MNIVGTALLESRNEMGIGIADKARKIELLRKEWLRHKAGDSEFAWFEDKKNALNAGSAHGNGWKETIDSYPNSSFPSASLNSLPIHYQNV